MSMLKIFKRAERERRLKAEKDPFKIIREIGSGAFGKVYLCEYSNELCALKRIPFDDELGYKKVLTEFNILTKYKHPRIVKFINFFNTSSNWNFIFEYMELGSFRNVLNANKREDIIISKHYLSYYFMDIVVGLRYLHQRNITHRDLKPENILVDNNHRLKIADFGISSILENSMGMNQTCIGTLGYMAPEVYLHKPYTISCDIWALGIILYEMAMLSYPFSKAERARILHPKLVFLKPQIDCARRGYSVTYQHILDHMIVREPERRATIKEISHMSIFHRNRIELGLEEVEFYKAELDKLRVA